MKKHYAILNIDNGKPRYICNGAVKVTSEKITPNKKEITCKNCLKVLKQFDFPEIKPEITLQKLQRDYKNYQEAQAYSAILLTLGILGAMMAIATTHILLGLILLFVSSVAIGFALGMKLKTIFKVLG